MFKSHFCLLIIKQRRTTCFFRRNTHVYNMFILIFFLIYMIKYVYSPNSPDSVRFSFSYPGMDRACVGSLGLERLFRVSSGLSNSAMCFKTLKKISWNMLWTRKHIIHPSKWSTRTARKERVWECVCANCATFLWIISLPLQLESNMKESLNLAQNDKSH